MNLGKDRTPEEEAQAEADFKQFLEDNPTFPTKTDYIEANRNLNLTHYCLNCQHHNRGSEYCNFHKRPASYRYTCKNYELANDPNTPKNKIIPFELSEYEKLHTQNKPKAKEGFFRKVFGSEKKEKIRIERSFYQTDQYLYEQVHDGGISQFARFNRATGQIDYVPNIEEEERTIEPIIGEEVVKGAVKLSSKAEEYGSDEALDKEILDFTYAWIDVPDDTRKFALWNIKRSWVYERFHTLNYLRALGDTGQGKSRFLDAFGSLHYKPVFTSGATTSAPVFRVIDKWRGTMIFDEADLKETDETADIIKIINMGYERGKFVMRCDQNDATKLQFFDPFCPKVLATRKPFTDKAVESRCVTQVMTGTKRKDIRFSLTDAFFQKSLTLRNKLLMWRFRNYDKINPDAQPDIGISDLEPRVQQIVSSYLALFGNNAEEMRRFKSFIEQYQIDLRQERADSWEGQIVKGIYELFHDQGQQDISAHDIIRQADLTDKKGELMKPRALTNVLKELGFGKTEVRKVEGKAKRCIPLEPEHLLSVFNRYGYEVTKVTIVTGTGDQQNNLIGYDSPPPHSNRNDSNSVTVSFNDLLKDTDYLVDDLLKVGYTESQLEIWKGEGLIYEPKNGVVRLV